MSPEPDDRPDEPDTEGSQDPSRPRDPATTEDGLGLDEREAGRPSDDEATEAGAPPEGDDPMEGEAPSG